MVIFLETAELRAKGKQEMRMAFWKQNVDQIITSNGLPMKPYSMCSSLTTGLGAPDDRS